MIRIFFTLAVLSASFILYAQAPQFAVVRPDGTTYICPTWDSAYNKAVNGDNIYLPGVTINSQINIDKRLNIYGAGHHPDSSSATGKTTVTTNVLISFGGTGGSIEGVQVSNSMVFNYTSRKIRDFTIKSCRFTYLNFGGVSVPVDSLPTNISIIENVFENINGFGASGNIISKNLIRYLVDNFTGSNISNNNFIWNQTGYMSGLTYCTFNNNIFLTTYPFVSNSQCTNTFNNNLKVGAGTILNGCPTNTGTENNTMIVASDNDIFVSYTVTSGFPYLDNYHLKPTCPGVNAGTDGTDVGIYGTSSPTSQGWVPSNPHIYFKQVAPQTNTNGQLQIQFKVRTNN